MSQVYTYAWGPRFVVPGLPVLDRKGEACRVLIRGRMNSALIEFVRDGYQAVVSRNALRRQVSNTTSASSRSGDHISRPVKMVSVGVK